jgi:hypothetical protein
MVVKNEIDQNLIDQMVNDFINEVLLVDPVLAYTQFSYDYNSFDFYLKAKDLLIPNAYVKRDGSYYFNTAMFIRLNINNVQHYAQQSKEKLFEELNKALTKSPEYKAYKERLDHV